MSRTDDQRVLDILDAADLIAGAVNDGREAWGQDHYHRVDPTGVGHRFR